MAAGLPSGAPDLDPRLALRLARRGVAIEAQPGERAEEQRQRLETALMGLFRDERDEASFRALYELSRSALLAWILSLMAGRRRALDPGEALQDTYINVYRYAGGFRDAQPRNFRVWSRTIAGNVLRRARRRAPQLSLDDLPEGCREPADLRPGPCELLAGGEDGRRLARAWTLLLAVHAQAFASLCARDRRALELIELEGLTYLEAGAHLAVGQANMKMIMFRARRRLRERMARLLDCGRAGTQDRLAG